MIKDSHCELSEIIVILTLRKVAVICAMFMVFILPGCFWNNGPSQEKIAAADFGEYPTQEKLKKLISAEIQSRFFDPYSIRDIEIKTPKQVWYKPKKESVVVFCYETRVLFTSSNTVGLDTGYKQYVVFIRNNSILYFDTLENYFGSRYVKDTFDSRPSNLLD
ncbi:MAG: hypothetical protein V1753_05110 [Pseudomonadota bacterium]